MHIDIVPLEGLDEGLRHPVRLRTVVRRRAGLEPHEPGKGDGLMGCIG